MSRAFKCDHCGKYFGGHGRHRLEGEVCDKEGGFVRYRPIMFVFPSTRRAGFDYDTSDKEFCSGCVKKILLAALNGEKL